MARAAVNREPGSDCDRPQKRALTGSTGPVNGEVAIAVRRKRHHGLCLVFGIVGDGEHQFVVASPGRQRCEIVDVGEFWHPRLSRLRDLSYIAGNLDRLHEPFDVGRPEVVWGGGGGVLGQLPHLPCPEHELFSRNLRPRRHVRRPTTRVRGLEGHQPTRAGLRCRTARNRRIERSGHRCAQDVGAVAFVGHAQRDAQVRIRPQVVFDDACRPLRGEYEVQAQRTTALRDVDHTVDELRHFLH